MSDDKIRLPRHAPATVIKANRARHDAWLADRVADGWVYADRADPAGCLPLTPGRRFKVHRRYPGEGGWWRFIRLVAHPSGSTWIDAYDAGGAYRSIALDRVRSVARDKGATA